MAFSDYSFDKDVPDFPSREQVLRYLNGYADHFSLREHIRFKSTVASLTPTEKGKWKIRTTENQSGEIFDFVSVCSGHYKFPNNQKIPGIENYEGTLLHSSIYRTPKAFSGKRVIVTGVGNSGADIAAELSNAGCNVAVVAPHTPWFVPRYINGRPFDHQLTRLKLMAPLSLRSKIYEAILLREYQRMGITTRKKNWPLQISPLDFRRSRLTVNSEILPKIVSNNIKVLSPIKKLNGIRATTSNGFFWDADAVILATGYSLRFPFLHDNIAPLQDSKVALYHHVFSPKLKNIAFLGMCTVVGAVFPIVELQARWIAKIFQGTLLLPSHQKMVQEIETRYLSAIKYSFDPTRVQFIDYLDVLAKQIDVKPRYMSNISHIKSLLTYPITALQYRINGPERIPHALRIMNETWRCQR